MDILLSALLFAKAYPLAVLLCLVAHMAIGMLWYGPLFSKPWSKLSGMDKVSKKEMKKAMAPAMAVSIISGIVQALVIGTILSAIPVTGYGDVVGLVVVLWLGFTGTVIATNFAYTQKSLKLFLIDAGYPLVSLSVMGAILHAWIG